MVNVSYEHGNVIIKYSVLDKFLCARDDQLLTLNSENDDYVQLLFYI